MPASLSATPANTVAVPPDDGLYRNRVVAPAPLSWPAKDPGDTALRAADFSGVVDPGATIVLWDTAVVPVGAALVAAVSGDGALVTLALVGGAAGVAAMVVITAVVSDGSVLTRGVALPVETLGSSQVPPPPADAITVAGRPLQAAGLPIEAPAGGLTVSAAPLNAGSMPLTAGDA